MPRKLDLDVDLDPALTTDETGGHGNRDAELLAERPPHHDQD